MLNQTCFAKYYVPASPVVNSLCIKAQTNPIFIRVKQLNRFNHTAVRISPAQQLVPMEPEQQYQIVPNGAQPINKRVQPLTVEFSHPLSNSATHCRIQPPAVEFSHSLSNSATHCRIQPLTVEFSHSLSNSVTVEIFNFLLSGRNVGGTKCRVGEVSYLLSGRNVGGIMSRGRSVAWAKCRICLVGEMSGAKCRVGEVSYLLSERNVGGKMSRGRSVYLLSGRNVGGKMSRRRSVAWAKCRICLVGDMSYFGLVG
uniref:Uncharacterized protein n=1 Tax=Globodera rostochiensis TaxID=31243 RepID=A0A914GP38_GLORO